MTRLGTLEFRPVRENLGWVAKPVAEALASLPGAEGVGVAEIDPALSDTASFCEQYDIGSELAANCVVVEGKRGEERKMAACVILATTRADINGVVRDFLGAKKVSFAPMEKAVEESKMEFGAITPIGLPPHWPILIDKAVVDSEYVIVGSGVRGSKLLVPGSFLASLPNVHIIEGLGQSRP